MGMDMLQSAAQGLRILEELKQKYPFHNVVHCDLIFAYIRLGHHDKAATLIEQIPDGKQNRWTLEVKSWLAYQQGDLKKAQSLWQTILAKHNVPTTWTHKFDELTYKSPHEIETSPHDILLFAVQRNEMLRLPSLLRHYRKLGVKHFFFIDNNSDDGSFEYLLAQPDCHVFWTANSFYEAGMGMAWINGLIHHFAAEGQWCIHPDADELLVYPHMETHNLQAFTQYLDTQGHQLVSSYMLDMYPANQQQQKSFQPEDNILETAPYFYNDYCWFHQVMCPYVFPYGGIFQYFDVNPGTLTKTSLFKFEKGFHFINSTHAATPLQVADVSSAFLHFKMLGDFHAKAISETKRKEHWAGGVNYKKYAQIYEQHTNEDTDLSALDKSVRYENSQQLVDLGLIRTSDTWEQFVAQSQS